MSRSKCRHIDYHILDITKEYLVVNENVIIKELASNLQVKIKKEIKEISDLEVEEVNVKVTSLKEIKKNKE